MSRELPPALGEPHRPHGHDTVARRLHFGAISIAPLQDAPALSQHDELAVGEIPAFPPGPHGLGAPTQQQHAPGSSWKPQGAEHHPKRIIPPCFGSIVESNHFGEIWNERRR